MTCMYQSQSTMDFRALMPIDNNSGYQMTGCNNGYYSGMDIDFNWMADQPQLDLDLDFAMDDSCGLTQDNFNSPSYGGLSLASSPLSQSSCPSNSSNSSSNSNSSCDGSNLVGSSSGGGLVSTGEVEAPSSGGSSSGRHAKNHRDDKICGVCGDRALGFNFDAISCESCKAFFRRNAPKGLDNFKCPYDEKCKMDTTNRRFCKRCRLKKCFQIGMKKEYILTDEEKATKRRKIEENRYLKKASSVPTSVKPTTTVTTSSERITSSLDSNNIGSLATYWPLTETKWQPTPAAPSTLAANWMTVPLSPQDAATINDLRAAYHKSLVNNKDESFSRKPQGNLKDLVNIAELSIRRVITMVKQVTTFRSLPPVEQIHLLKGGSIELLIIRSVMTFDEEKQHFLDPVDHEETSAMRLDQLQMAEKGLGLFDEHMKFIRSLATDLRADETTLILLLVISLFSPDRENLTRKDLVSREQEKYSLLLKSYLESIHPLPVARMLYPKLLMKLTDIRNLNEEHTQVLLKVNSEGIHPLMKEVLDLSS